MSSSGFRHYLFLVDNINLLPFSIYNNLETNLTKHNAFLIFQESGIYLISVFSNIFSKSLTLTLAPLTYSGFQLDFIILRSNDLTHINSSGLLS